MFKKIERNALLPDESTAGVDFLCGYLATLVLSACGVNRFALILPVSDRAASCGAAQHSCWDKASP